jgi:hypothetical protein
VLRAAGLRMDETFSNHLVVDAVGPSNAVERLFTTELHDLAQAAHGVRYAPLTNATVPSSLAPYVAGLNLDNVVTMNVPRH